MTNKETNNSVKKNTKVKEATIVEQEPNQYAKAILSTVVVIILVVCAFVGINNKDKGKDIEVTYVATEDEKKFKNEYESLNGTYSDVSIIEDNNIEYITLDQAAKIIDSGSGVIYFGYATNPMSRLAIPILLNAMGGSNLDKIYYVSLRDDYKESDIRDVYELNSKNKAKKVKEAASQSYYEILVALADYLNDYTLTTQTGNTVSTGEKRLSAPSVVAVKDGVIIDVKTMNEEQTELSKDEEKKLGNAYNDLISYYLSDSCDIEQTSGC